MKLYHGTSWESYQSIKKDGFYPLEKTWSCSENDTTYFYDPSKFDCCETTEEMEYEAITQAIMNGRISCAIQGSLSDKMVVIEYETDDSEDIEPDYSCPNMDEAVCIENAKKENIKRVFVTDYYPDLRIFYLKGLDRNYLDVGNLRESTIGLLDNKALDVYIEEIYEQDFTLLETLN